MRITGFDNQSGESGGELYAVEHEGQTYSYEVWSALGNTGADWSLDGNALNDAPWMGKEGDFERDQQFEALLEKFQTAFYGRWLVRVQPIIDTITREAIEETDPEAART
jgi:hypothetical protein